eukprot:scaffold5372_cov114-Isochrysis_galbana.AAC.3
MPDLLHVIPVGHDTVLDRVLERQDTTLGLRLIAHVRVLLAHANHHAGLTRAANDGREDSARGVVARESGLAHAGPVINHESSDIIISHFVSESRGLSVWQGGRVGERPGVREAADVRERKSEGKQCSYWLGHKEGLTGSVWFERRLRLARVNCSHSA